MSRAAAYGMRQIFLVLVTAVAACADSDPDAADIAVVDGENIGNGLADKTGIEFIDDAAERIVAKSGAIVMALDEAQLLVADFALSISTDPIVRDYAKSILFDYSQHLFATADLLLSVGLQREENPISRALHLEAERNVRTLATLPFNGFDFQLARLEIVMHSEALIIVGTLQQFAPLIEMELFFDETIGMLEAHRVVAEQILRTF
jgi:predicted outer membrane protein